MPFRSFAQLALVVFIGGACIGCHIEYRATLLCIECNGTVGPEQTGEWSCTPEGATASAGDKCVSGEIPGSPTFEERLVFNFGGCSEDRAVSVLPDVALNVKGLTSQLTGVALESQFVQAADGPTCPPKKLDMKVTVFQDVPVAECPGAMDAEVTYQRYISEGVYESTTLSATVSVGGKHDFVCVDAGVTEFGKVGTINVRVYSDLNCVGEMPLAIGQAYSQIPADGSRLEVRANLETLMFDDEIIPPTLSAMTADAVVTVGRPALVPVPDPMFTKKGK